MFTTKNPLWLSLAASLALITPAFFLPSIGNAQDMVTGGQLPANLQNTELDDIEWDPASGYHEEEWYDPSDWIDADEGIEYEDEWLGWDYTPAITGNNYDEYDYIYDDYNRTAGRLGDQQIRSRFPSEELDDVEWDPSSGYHEEEWYDPSDWIDADEGVEYEDEWFGYDFTPAVDYQDYKYDYNYDYGDYGYNYEDYNYESHDPEADRDFVESMYGEADVYPEDYEWDFTNLGYGYEYDEQESFRDQAYYEDFDYGQDTLGWDFYDRDYDYENVRFNEAEGDEYNWQESQPYNVNVNE